MSNGRSWRSVFVASALASTAVAIGYMLTHPEAVKTVDAACKKLVRKSKENFQDVSEDVALKTARVTNNPDINKDWVENQWNALEY